MQMQMNATGQLNATSSKPGSQPNPAAGATPEPNHVRVFRENGGEYWITQGEPEASRNLSVEDYLAGEIEQGYVLKSAVGVFNHPERLRVVTRLDRKAATAGTQQGDDGRIRPPLKFRVFEEHDQRYFMTGCTGEPPDLDTHLANETRQGYQLKSISGLYDEGGQADEQESTKVRVATQLQRTPKPEPSREASSRREASSHRIASQAKPANWQKTRRELAHSR